MRWILCTNHTYPRGKYISNIGCFSGNSYMDLYRSYVHMTVPYSPNITHWNK